ncbi:hypothetical protein KY346_04255 [Candidatus Woesearchaeota archaeon]|nr:hypothetical protein [Candidatus Woesearchaeota archaeon]
MKVKKEPAKIKLDLKLSNDVLDLRTINSNIVLKKLEENMKLREMKIEKHLEKELKKI